jgi:hypothetical protein
VENWFLGATFLLFGLAFLTFVVIVHDVLHSLNTEDQTALRNYLAPAGFREWRQRSRAMRNAWNEHYRLFPSSRKRVLFALLLVATFLSVMGYPIWLALGKG